MGGKRTLASVSMRLLTALRVISPTGTATSGPPAARFFTLGAGRFRMRMARLTGARGGPLRRQHNAPNLAVGAA